MSYPTSLQEYRESLSSKRGRPQELWEVLIPDVLCYSSDDSNRVNWGIVNNRKAHWALVCRDQALSFVWNIEQGDNGVLVKGAKCLTDYERIDLLSRRNWIGVTGLSVEDIRTVGISSQYTKPDLLGNFLCSYGGCHHVLWKRRADFVHGLLYLVLDNPLNRNPLKYFDAKTVFTDHGHLTNIKEMFYLNPERLNFHDRSDRSLRLLPSSCGPSQFLEDLKLDHKELKDCDIEIEGKLASCVEGVYKEIEERVLMEDLDRKVSGLWWCIIL